MDTTVFISSKSADYKAARQVYEYLTRSGITCFFSDESLAQAGDSEYKKTIDRALDRAMHLVLVTSSTANAESKWVRYEWDSFDNELLSGRKSGNIVVVLCEGMDQGSLPYALRRRQTITFPDQLGQMPSYLAAVGPTKNDPPESRIHNTPLHPDTGKSTDHTGSSRYRRWVLLAIATATGASSAAWLFPKFRASPESEFATEQAALIFTRELTVPFTLGAMEVWMNGAFLSNIAAGETITARFNPKRDGKNILQTKMRGTEIYNAQTEFKAGPKQVVNATGDRVTEPTTSVKAWKIEVKSITP